MLSREQVAEVVRDRVTYYWGMARAGWLLPTIKQSLATLSFLQGVRAGEVFCPHAQHVKTPAVCVTPPPKKVLIDKIFCATVDRAERGEDTSRLDNLLLLLQKKSADSAWLVQVLHLVNDQDEIFARDYVYVRPRPVKAKVEMPFMDNSDGFFSGLPKLPASSSSKRQLRLTKQQKEALQLQSLEHRQAELAKKIALLKSRGAGEANGAAASSHNNGSSSGEEGEDEKEDMDA